MNGLLSQAKQASQPAPTEQPPGPPAEGEIMSAIENPPPGVEAEEMEEMTPEEEEIFQQATAEVLKAVMADNYIERVLRRMTKRDPIIACAQEAVRAVKVFDGAVGKTIPREIIANVCMEVASCIHEVAIKGEIMQNDEQTATALVGAVIAEVENTFGEDEGEPEEEVTDGQQ